MTRRLRIIVLAAIVAALFGAPSAVFGAAPTRLYAATASPTSGTTATTFTFSVRFDGSGKFEAGQVIASVAGRSLTMTCISGSATSGTYSASTTLPAGSWIVTFRTLPASGPAATLTGPTMSVLAPTPKLGTPVPTSTTISAASDPPPPSPTSVSVPVEPAPSGSVVAAPTETASPGSAPGGSDAGVAAPGGAGSGTSGGSSAGSAGSSSGDGGQTAPKATAENAGAGASASDVRPSGSMPPGAGRDARPLGSGPTPIDNGLAYILGAIAAATAFGAFVLLLWRRRDDEEDVPAVATPLAAPSAVAPSKLGPRAMRRGRSEQANDPILESMGLNEGTDASKITVNASQVHRGPGVREPRRRRR